MTSLKTKKLAEEPHSQAAPSGSAFIDKVQFVIPCDHTDRMSIGKVGNHWFDAEDGISLPGEDKMKWKEVPGPDGNAMVRTYDPPANTLIEVLVTPGIYFQGHNAFASADLLGLCIAAARDLAARLELTLSPETLTILHSGDFRLRRVDVTAMIDLGSREAVRNMLNRAEHSRHRWLRSQPKRYEDNVFYRGTDYSFKLYDKHSQLQDPKAWGHGCQGDAQRQVHEWTWPMLRAEMTIREKKLRQLGGLDRACGWSLDMPTHLVREQLRNLRMDWDCDSPPEIVDALPPKIYQYYYAIKGGAASDKCFLDRHTRKKYTDILSKLYEKDHSQRSSLIDLNNMDFAPIPEWAINSVAYFITRQA